MDFLVEHYFIDFPPKTLIIIVRRWSAGRLYSTTLTCPPLAKRQIALVIERGKQEVMKMIEEEKKCQ